MIKKLFGILLLLVLLAQFLPGGLFPPDRVNAQEPAPSSKISSIQAQATANVSKISSMLNLQVQAKLQAAKTSGMAAASQTSNETGFYNALQLESMRFEDLNKQQVFIHLAQKPNQQQIDELKAAGITVYQDSWLPPVGDHPTGFILADMPVDKLDLLAEKSYVTSLETAEQLLEPQNDLGAQKMNVPDVWASGYNGTGVRIAVLDSGLDLTHPDIPTPVIGKDFWNYPTSIDDTIANIPGVTGHGTHVAGSVLGRGTQSGGVYKGSAPGADLIFLKIGSDATGSATSAAMIGAIRAATDNYSADIITMSYGGWSTYHDGSEETSQAVEYAFSQGVVVLISAGNDGARGKHYSGTVSASSNTSFIQVNVSGAGTDDTGIDLNLVWYDGLGTSNDLVMEYYNSTYTLLASTNGVQSQSSRGTESEESHHDSPVPPGSSTYYVKVKNNSTNSQFFHIYMNYCGTGSVTFQSPDTGYTLSSPAEADNAIAVGAYTTRKVWYDYANNGWQSSAETVDQIATFSSRGPRVDTGAPGKPNIVAPGKNIISARDNVVYPWSSKGMYYVDNDGPNENNATKNNSLGPADYYVMGGTSMACPLAAGVAALILQANPSLTPAQVRDILQTTATDKGTAGPDPVYGAGLVNAQAAIASIGVPTVTTLPADDRTTTSARIRGNLASLGTSSNVTVSFEWGPVSGSGGFQTSGRVINSTGNFSANLTGLNPATTYYFKAKAVGNGIGYGSELSFTTLTPGGPFNRLYFLGFNTTMPYLFNDSRVRQAVHLTLDRPGIENAGSDNLSGSVGQVLSIVNPNIRKPTISPPRVTANASLLLSEAGYPDGFVTKLLVTPADVWLANEIRDDLDIVGIDVQLDIREPSVYSDMLINKNFQMAIIRAGFDWNHTPSLLGRMFYSTSLMNFTGFFSLQFDQQFDAQQFNAAEDTAFPTMGPTSIPLLWYLSPVEVLSKPATDIMSMSATLNGAAFLGTAPSANVSFEWGPISGNLTQQTPVQIMASSGNFSANITGLQPQTLYYFRSKATTANLTINARELSFVTGELTSIALSPINLSLLPGRTQQFTATGNYSDSSTANITASVTWTSSNTSVAIISPSGFTTALAGGIATIIAASGNVSGNTTLTVTTSVEVNSGQALTLTSGESRSNIPVIIKGIPELGAGNGVGGFTFDFSWNKNVINVDNVTAAVMPGFSIVAGTANNTSGNVTVTGFALPAYLTNNATVAYFTISAVGSTGNTTTLDIIVRSFGDKDGNPIPASPVNAPVQIINLVAETGIVQGPSNNVTGVIAVNVNINRIKNPADNSTATIPGGIGSYSATINGTAGAIQFLNVYGVPPFNSPTFDNVTGNFSVVAVSSPIQPNNATVAQVIPILTGSSATSVNLNVTFQSIGAAGQPGLNVPEVQPNTIAFRRGDADKNGVVSVVDSLAIKQYLVGQLTLSQINPLNSASPNHDYLTFGGDKISVVDALAVEQYLVNQRNAYFE